MLPRLYLCCVGCILLPISSALPLLRVWLLRWLSIVPRLLTHSAIRPLLGLLPVSSVAIALCRLVVVAAAAAVLRVGLLVRCVLLVSLSLLSVATILLLLLLLGRVLIVLLVLLWLLVVCALCCVLLLLHGCMQAHEWHVSNTSEGWAEEIMQRLDLCCQLVSSECLMIAVRPKTAS